MYELEANGFKIYEKSEYVYFLYSPENKIYSYGDSRNYIITTSSANLNALFLIVCRLQNELIDLKEKFNDLRDMVMYHPALGTIPDELKRDFDDKKNRLK